MSIVIGRVLADTLLLVSLIEFPYRKRTGVSENIETREKEISKLTASTAKIDSSRWTFPSSDCETIRYTTS